jgi:arylsulfatase A-like enzyme
MASEGTHIETCVTCQPVCGPARSCLQTGMYATRTGSWRNGIPLDTSLKTMAHYFREAGYSTGYIGKWHLGSETGAVPLRERGGYEHWLAANLLEFVSDAYDCVLFDKSNRKVRLPGYRVDAITDAAIRFIDKPRRKPFFLFVSYLEPHHQNHIDDYPPPEGYRERYTGGWVPPDLQALGGSTAQHLGGYYGMIKRLDEALGRTRDALKSTGLTDDTVLLYTTDHGCHFKTRNDEYKRSCHESSVRLPTAVVGPGFTSGGRRKEICSLLDLPPTLLDAAGVRVPKCMQGRSIMPVLRGEGSDWEDVAYIQISESQVGRAIRTRRWKYGVVAEGLHGGKVGSAETYTETYLYDLETDPYELTNLAGVKSHRKIASQLREIILRKFAEAGEKQPEIILAKARKSRQSRVAPATL